MKTSIQEINNQGVVHFLNQNFDEAKKKYEEALAQDSNNTTALNNLGLLYLHQKISRHRLRWTASPMKL